MFHRSIIIDTLTPTRPPLSLEPAGLTSAQAARLLASGGPNTVADIAEHPARRALKKLWAPVPWMLEAAILLQLVTGAYAEAGVVALLLVTNAALGYFQEGRAQATLDALKSRLALTAAVRRDGVWRPEPAASLVIGDAVKLSLGSVVPADIRLDAGLVLIDQSMLTGESVAVDVGPGADAYAGALVRRGEAAGHVTATGTGTKFGRTTELVRSAKVVSSQQKTIMAVVRNLVLFNGGVTILLTLYALWLPMPRDQIVSLALVAILASIPVALPAMFTLAAAVGARALAQQGVLPTSLSAVDEAAGIDVLCADKTGTLTRNELAVMAVAAMPGFNESEILALAALASSDGGQDPVDAALRVAATAKPVTGWPGVGHLLRGAGATASLEFAAWRLAAAFVGGRRADRQRACVQGPADGAVGSGHSRRAVPGGSRVRRRAGFREITAVPASARRLTGLKAASANKCAGTPTKLPLETKS